MVLLRYSGINQNKFWVYSAQSRIDFDGYSASDSEFRDLICNDVFMNFMGLNALKKVLKNFDEFQ